MSAQPLALPDAPVRATGSNFYYAFLSLPKARREGIIAVYGFCHAVDDAVDAAPDPVAAAQALDAWRDELDRVYRGTPRVPVGVRLAPVVARYALPRHVFEEVIAGVASDLAPGRRFANWDELAAYCDLVAGAVGRLSVRVFGAADDDADRYAAALGAALQLTNILRDLGPDAAAGRFYLPQDDLARHGLREADVTSPARGPTAAARAALLAFEARRARDLYARARRAGRGRERLFVAAEIMAAIYGRLLEEVERRGFPDTVVRLPRWRKGLIALRRLAACRLAPWSLR